MIKKNSKIIIFGRLTCPYTLKAIELAKNVKDNLQEDFEFCFVNINYVRDTSYKIESDGFCYPFNSTEKKLSKNYSEDELNFFKSLLSRTNHHKTIPKIYISNDKYTVKKNLDSFSYKFIGGYDDFFNNLSKLTN